MDTNLTQGSGNATGTNTYAVDLSVKVSALKDDGFYLITFANSNTASSPTLNINGIGDTAMTDESGNALPIGAILPNIPYQIYYTGSSFTVMGTMSFPIKMTTGGNAIKIGEFSGITGFNDWKHRTAIDANASAAVTDYQIRLTIDTAALISAGKMESDGKDIRFTLSDGTTIVPHHVESGINTTTTVIYFKATVAIGSNDFFMYHGNSAATTTDDPENVFEFYDSFPGTSIDTGKWTITDGTGFSVAGGVLTGTDTTGRLQSVPNFTEPVIAETKYNTVTDPSNGVMALSFWESTTNGLGFLDHDTPANDFTRNDGTWTSVGNVTPSSVDLLIRITPNGASSNIFVERLDTGADLLDVTLTNTVTAERLMIGTRADNLSPGQVYNASWDWIRVRKFTATEPTVTIGAETQINPDYFSISPTGDIIASKKVTASNLKTHDLIEDRSVAPNVTSTSASFATAASSDPTVFSGRPVLFLFHGSAYSTLTGDKVEFAIQIDSGADNVISSFFFNTLLEHHNMTGWVRLTPSAGEKTINLRIRRVLGTGTITMDNNDQILVSAIEL